MAFPKEARSESGETGIWRRNSRGQAESYWPAIGEIVSYPRSRGGVAVATRCNGVLYDCVNEHGSRTVNGVWDMQPATDEEKARLRSKLDLASVETDRTFQNALPGGRVGHAEFLKAAKARLKKRVFGEASDRG